MPIDSRWWIGGGLLVGIAVVLWPREEASASTKDVRPPLEPRPPVRPGTTRDTDGGSMTSTTTPEAFLAAAPDPGIHRERYFESHVDAPAWAEVVLAPGVKIRVSSDVVKAQGVRVPLWPSTAQRVADRFDAILPTPKLSDAIHRAANVQLVPRSMRPRTGVARDSNVLLGEHEHLVNAAVAAAAGTRAPAGLIDGAKKDIVVGKAMRPDMVTIYGWHRPDGTVVQPVFSGHSERYSDYSHGARLVSRTATVNGNSVPIESLFANPELAQLVSGEGTLTREQLRYPT